jgi:hypothetical protein
VGKKIRFSKSLNFPHDYDVKVKWQDHAEFVDEHGDTGVSFFEYTDGKPGGIMYLDSSRPLGELLDDIEHELGHVLVEWREHFRCYWREKLKQFLMS